MTLTTNKINSINIRCLFPFPTLVSYFLRLTTTMAIYCNGFMLFIRIVFIIDSPIVHFLVNVFPDTRVKNILKRNEEF